MKRLPALLALLVLASALPAAAQDGGPTVYVAFGDSITDGVGDDDAREEKGYPPRLEDLLNAAGQDAVVLNRGVGAERTPEGLARLDEVLAQADGDVLLLMEGSNDVSRLEISIETIRFNLAEMARRAEARGLRVVHATTIPRTPRALVDPDNVLNQQLNRQIRDLAGTQGRDLVDNFQIFGALPNLFEDFYQDVPTDFVGHPNASGYDVMARAFFNVLTGVDEVPPVPGIVSPRNGDRQVPPGTSIRVDVWDFGAGIDLSGTSLRVNGQVVTPTVTGSQRQATFIYQPPQPLVGTTTVELATRDLATPPNSEDREIARFIPAGTVFLPGDIDQNGRVDGRDLVDFATRFGANQGQDRYNQRADVDNDGDIDGDDLAALAANFGQSSF